MIEINYEILKKALLDSKFRKQYPEFKEEINKWIENPGCKCNIALYNSLLANQEKLQQYFGSDIVVNQPMLDNPPSQENHWAVFNGHINDLEKFLHELKPGPKQIAIARFEDQVTVIINEPEFND